MGTDADICYLSIAELERAYAERRLSPVEVTRAYLHRIERLDSRLHSYITVTGEAALAAAKASQERLVHGRARGALEGVPIALKDLYDTAGVRTTAQSPLYADRVPAADAAAVRRMTAAGAFYLGKLTMYEFAANSPRVDSRPPPARNPWNIAMIPGGSSSGAGAAVAAGLCTAALGTDSGGSIRGPASHCGIVGLKPTYGLVSRVGCVPLSWTFDHAGPMTRTVEDAALLLQVLAGYDPYDSASARVHIPDYRSGLAAGIAGLRIGAPIGYVEAMPDLDPETLATYREALATLERLGATLRNVVLPDFEHEAAIYATIVASETFAFHERVARERPDGFGRDFCNRLLGGALFTAADYIQAQRGRAMLCQAMGRLMESVDLLVLPTSPHPAWDFAAEAASPPDWARPSFRHPFNVTGQPAISLPCGFSSRGLPIGLQIVGRPFEDGTVLAAAHAYERTHEWFAKRPPLDD